ncbi:MAG: hypothetical protein MUF71_11870 [Candidatus Kapabacteria bacterium]|jgi:hypothetical protein|nr:hypothetical protein [Candidatus Kapabacteria bacterium]
MNPNINHRQEALLHEIFDRVHERFPMLQRTGEIETSPDDPRHFWIFASGTMTAEQESDALDLAGEIEAEILDQYGYRLSLMLLTDILEEEVFA